MYFAVSESNAPGLSLRSFGTSVVFHGIERAVLEQSGKPMDMYLFFEGFRDIEVQPTAQLVFSGIPVTIADIQGYIGMLCATLGLALLSAPMYGALSNVNLPKIRRAKQSEPISEQRPLPAYCPVLPQKQAPWRGLVPELRLTLSGQPLIWKIASAAGIVSCLFIELRTLQTYVQPLLMIWFINVFSAMGSREHRHDILKCVSVLPNGRLKQVVFSWISGILIAFGISSPAILRMALTHQSDGILACLAGVVFLPSLAIFLGELTKTNRIFELSFVIITYLILNNVPAVMYMGISPGFVSLARSGVYFIAGIVMGAVAVLKRMKYA
jgi:hypothetical protein